MSQDASNFNDTLEIGSEEEVPSNPISNWNVELILPVNKQNISNDDLEKEQADENNNAQTKNWDCECGKNYYMSCQLKKTQTKKRSAKFVPRFSIHIMSLSVIIEFTQKKSFSVIFV